jgi:hypothetical protein
MSFKTPNTYTKKASKKLRIICFCSHVFVIVHALRDLSNNGSLTFGNVNDDTARRRQVRGALKGCDPFKTTYINQKVSKIPSIAQGVPFFFTVYALRRPSDI